MFGDPLKKIEENAKEDLEKVEKQIAECYNDIIEAYEDLVKIIDKKNSVKHDWKIHILKLRTASLKLKEDKTLSKDSRELSNICDALLKDLNLFDRSQLEHQLRFFRDRLLKKLKADFDDSISDIETAKRILEKHQ